MFHPPLSNISKDNTSAAEYRSCYTIETLEVGSGHPPAAVVASAMAELHCLSNVEMATTLPVFQHIAKIL